LTSIVDGMTSYIYNSTMGGTDDSQGFVAQTVRVPEELMARLRVKLAQDGAKFQKKALELLEAYVNSEQAQSEHDRRMRIAKEEMERFRKSFEILAK
jgi:hypothetical protein